MSNKQQIEKAEFLNFHSGYFGEEVDNINQIVQCSFTGEELMEYLNSFALSLSEKEECRYCNGDGSIEWGNSKHECVKCNGTGNYLSEKEEEWIRCDERLPEVQQFVLAYLPAYGNPNIQTLWRADWANGETWFNVFWKTYNLDEVTHWMPLPNIPKSK